MEKLNTTIVIPALRLNSNFRGDLLRKFGGISLLQRTIDKAVLIGGKKAVLLFSDIEEATLIGERNSIRVVSSVSPSEEISQQILRAVVAHNVSDCDQHGRITMAVVSPYSPLMKAETIEKAIRSLEDRRGNLVLVPISEKRIAPSRGPATGLSDDLFAVRRRTEFVDSTAFSVVQFQQQDALSNLVFKRTDFPVSDDALEVFTQRDWQASNKLLDMRHVVLRVIGAKSVGMGHIYRCLSLAHEMIDHRVTFVCCEEDDIAIRELTAYDYELQVFDKKDMVSQILRLEPDLVVNDILDTQSTDVDPLVEARVKVVNFEDLGVGANRASLTINELYDTPIVEGENILWGKQYFFLRDEFMDACPQEFSQVVSSILIVFGGTDQHDLSRKVFDQVSEFCRERGIHIYIVTGPGYENYQELKDQVQGEDGVSITHSTGVISKIMEATQLAITSNGRTVYELAHMNIPAIVIPLHDREKTHGFACEANGFVPMNPYEEGVTEKTVLQTLRDLTDDHRRRRMLFEATEKITFVGNKRRVCQLINDLVSNQSNEARGC